MYPDVVIIGGGIIGACCAYYLSLEGVKVYLVERDHIASGASGAGEGNICHEAMMPGMELTLTMASAALWDQFSPDMHRRIEYHKADTLQVVGCTEHLEGLEQNLEDHAREGVHGTLLSPKELFELEPNLARDVPGGAVFSGYNAHMQPMLATIALTDAARDMGAVVRTFTEVTGLQLSRDGAVEGVNTTSGPIPTRIVVIAAGAWSHRVGEMLGLDIPIVPRRGHMLVTEAVEDLVFHLVTEASYIATVEETDDSTKPNVCTIVELTDSGNLLLGSSRDTLAGFDPRVNAEIISAIAAGAVRFFPCLREVQVIRSYAGLRPCSPDLTPIIDRAEGHGGVYIATGHEGNGITTGPITGKLISEMITGKELSLPDEQMSKLSLSRFQAG